METLTDSGLVSYGGKVLDTTTGTSLVRIRRIGTTPGNPSSAPVAIGQARGEDPRIVRQLHKWSDGDEGKRLLERYRRDGAFRERIQRFLERWKLPGGDNRKPDEEVSPDDIDEAIRKADEKSEERWKNRRGGRRTPFVRRISEDGLQGYNIDPGSFTPKSKNEQDDPDWYPWLLGGAIVIVGGAAILFSGGLAAPEVVGGAGGIIVATG